MRARTPDGEWTVETAVIVNFIMGREVRVEELIVRQNGFFQPQFRTLAQIEAEPWYKHLEIISE